VSFAARILLDNIEYVDFSEIGVEDLYYLEFC